MSKHKEVNDELQKRYDTMEKRLRELEAANEDDGAAAGVKRRREE